MFQGLANKKVVVIGASSGIGLAVARETAKLEAHVVMSSRSIDKLNQAMASVSGRVEAISADILNKASINWLFEQVEKFDHLVVTAIADENLLRSPLSEMTVEIAQRGMEKFWRTFFAIRAAVKNIAQDGAITLTSSVSIFKPARHLLRAGSCLPLVVQ